MASCPDNIATTIQAIHAKIATPGKETRRLRIKSREKHFRVSTLAGTGYLDDKTADVHIICKNGQVVKAHRLILCLASEFFGTLFNGETSTEISVVSIPDIAAETMVIILTLVYRDGMMIVKNVPEVNAWIQVFQLGDRVGFEPHEATDPQEEEQEQVQQLIHPCPLEVEDRQVQIPPQPTPTNGQQQQIENDGQNRNVQQNSKTILEVDAFVPENVDGELPVLEGMEESAVPGTSKAKKRVGFTALTLNAGTRGSGILHTRQEPARPTCTGPSQNKRSKVSNSFDRAQSEVLMPKPTKVPAAAAVGSARQARAGSESKSRTRTNRSTSRTRTYYDFDDTASVADSECSEVPGDYSGKNKFKLLGTHPKSARLKAKLLNLPVRR